MKGTEHYLESEHLSDVARGVIKAADAHREEKLTEHGIDSPEGREAMAQWAEAGAAARNLIELAGVHATLALAAAVERAGDSAHGYGTGGYGR